MHTRRTSGKIERGAGFRTGYVATRRESRAPLDAGASAGGELRAAALLAARLALRTGLVGGGSRDLRAGAARAGIHRPPVGHDARLHADRGRLLHPPRHLRHHAAFPADPRRAGSAPPPPTAGPPANLPTPG